MIISYYICFTQLLFSCDIFFVQAVRSFATSSPWKLIEPIKRFASPQGPLAVFFISGYVICHLSGINKM